MKAIVPFLNFNGNCRDAMSFYQRCIGGTLDIATFGQFGVWGQDDWCAFALLTSGSTVLMASDASPETPSSPGSNVWLCFQCDTDAEVEALFASLGEGGTEIMRPHDAVWGARFAMLTDRYGMQWMLSHNRPAAPSKNSTTPVSNEYSAPTITSPAS